MDIQDVKGEVRTQIKEEFGSGLAGKMAGAFTAKAFEVVINQACTEENILDYVNGLFTEHDQDGDGTITFEEFKAFLEKHNSKAATQRLDITLDDTNALN